MFTASACDPQTNRVFGRIWMETILNEDKIKVTISIIYSNLRAIFKVDFNG